MKKGKVITASLVVVIVVLAVLNLVAYTTPRTNINTNLGGIEGIVTVSVLDENGTVVSQTKTDAITTLSYDYIACLVWQVGCTSNSGAASDLIYNTSVTITTTATVTSFLPFMSSLDGIALSSASQTGSLCTSALDSNGMSPLVASITHGVGQNSPIVTLTASWTATASVSAVQAVCLIPSTSNSYISQFPVGPVQSGSSLTDYAYENFASQALTSGQSISVTWTFNM